jgi:hypothetical protein
MSLDDYWVSSDFKDGNGTRSSISRDGDGIKLIPMGIYMLQILSPSGIAGTGMILCSPSPLPTPRTATRTKGEWTHSESPHLRPICNQPCIYTANNPKKVFTSQPYPHQAAAAAASFMHQLPAKVVFGLRS